MPMPPYPAADEDDRQPVLDRAQPAAQWRTAMRVAMETKREQQPREGMNDDRER